MTASIRTKDTAAPIIEETPRLDHDNNDAAPPYIWLDSHASSDNDTPMEEGVDLVPTLHDVYEQFSQDDGGGEDQAADRVFSEPDDEMLVGRPPSMASSMDADTEVAVKVAALSCGQHAENDPVATEHHNDPGQASIQSLEDVFSLVRHDPTLLQRALLGVACTFQIIAAAALWQAIGDRVIVTALVPPLVYASIGVVAYLLGMRYLRIHFAQVRVGDKDWLLCEQVVVAADNGIMLKARFGTAYLIWEQLLGVAQDGDYYYLLIEPSQGFKVPKQGVSDPVLKIKLDDLASLTRAKALQSA